MFEACITYDYDFGGLYSREMRPIARKAHTCCECFRVISKGERYSRVEGITEGSWYTAKTCLSCVGIRASLFRGDWIIGNLWGDIADTFCNGRDDEIAMMPETWLAKQCWYKATWGKVAG